MAKHVMIAGPEGVAAFAAPLAEKLAAIGVAVDTHFGALADIRGEEKWRRAQILLSLLAPCGAAEMDAAPELEALITATLGYECLDVPAATARGIVVTNGQVPENYESMAEATIMLVLALLYDLRGSEARLRERRWRGTTAKARMLKGRTVGIVGYGNIARAVIARLAGWEARILVHTRTVPAEAPPGVRFVALEELVRESDVLLPLASLNPTSGHLLDAAHLAMMKPDATLVNTARGGLIDEAALAELARAGRIARLALDVFEEEPLAPDSPLLTLPGAILTPHDIGHTAESTAGVVRVAIENVRAVAEGRLPAHVINREVLGHARLLRAGTAA